MYRVLLADDDPIALSGIKRLIDWKKNGCVIEETAADGITARKKIERLLPDLVICDIAMPGLSGIDLLKYSNEKVPGTVFIMLTNHENFSFARESIHYRAAGYLVKSELKPQALEAVLAQAVAESENRKKLRRVEEADKLLLSRERQERIRNALADFLHGKLPPENKELLHEEKMLSCFAFAFIPLDFAFAPKNSDVSAEDQHKIFDWETEIAEYLAASFFQHSFVLPYSSFSQKPENNKNYYQDLLLFAWKLEPETWESNAAHFRERLVKTSGQITQLGADVMASEFYASVEADWEKPAADLRRLAEQHYQTKNTQSEAVIKALQYIINNVERKLTLNDVAKFACISPGYLSTLFKREYKQNLMDFINQTKINYACELLKKNKYRINEISNRLGFENAFYFSRVFRRHTDLTPSEFRSKEISKSYSETEVLESL